MQAAYEIRVDSLELLMNSFCKAAACICGIFETHRICTSMHGTYEFSQQTWQLCFKSILNVQLCMSTRKGSVFDARFGMLCTLLVHNTRHVQ
jgi:hypothetical protein